jgi:hypothetical protein
MNYILFVFQENSLYNGAMDTNSATKIFFIISSVGFVLLWILVAIFLYYLIRAMHAFSSIMEKIEKDIGHIGDTTREMLEDIRDNIVYRFFFGKKRKGRKS